MRAIFERKRVYGRTLYYPLEPAARALCDITDTKTLTGPIVDNADVLGIDLYEGIVVDSRIHWSQDKPITPTTFEN